MDVGQAIEQYHSACHAFATGDPAPFKSLYARSDDVLLANPLRFEELSRYTSADLVALFEHEHWETKVRGRSDLSPFDLRVTTTFRREAGGGKLVGRHADPLTTPHVDGPLRPTS